MGLIHFRQTQPPQTSLFLGTVAITLNIVKKADTDIFYPGIHDLDKYLFANL